MEALGFGAGLALQRAPALPPVFDFSGGMLLPGAVLTRASAGRRFDAGGVLVGVAADAARFDRHPATGVARGLLVEPAATNLLPWSDRIELFGETNQCTVASDVGTAPDGSGGFDRLVPSIGTGVFPYVADTSFAKVAGTIYTLSSFVRRESLRWVLLSGGLYGDARFAWFDLLTGTVGTVGASASGAAIQAIDSNTFRIAVTFTGSTSPYCLLAPVKADASFGADYASGDTLGAWGAMLETGARATSPVATAGAAATRAADVLTLDWGMRGVADGAATMRCTFDDGSTQDLAATVANGRAAVPANLARPWLLRAALI